MKLVEKLMILKQIARTKISRDLCRGI